MKEVEGTSTEVLAEMTEMLKHLLFRLLPPFNHQRSSSHGSQANSKCVLEPSAYLLAGDVSYPQVMHRI